MTAFVALVTPEQAFLAIDALACDGPERSPHNLVTKLFPLPSMRMVMFGTGLLDFMLEWLRMLEHRFILADVETVDRYASDALRELWRRYAALGETTTIYHIGYARDQFRWYAYGSDRQFASQPLPHALVVNPADGVAEAQRDGTPLAGTPTLDTLVRYFVDIMEIQKQHDDQQPIGRRLGIGGEVYFLVMLPPAEYRLFVCHRFSDIVAVSQQIQAAAVPARAS